MARQQNITELLERGVSEVIHRGHLERRLLAGKPLRVKLGIDPTSPDIHLGRAVVLRKLRAFQELGHKAIFMVGDFTALIGDTSDKDAERPMLTQAQVKQNMKTYLQQAFKILDPKKTEIQFNSHWLKKLGFLEIGRMADAFGLHEFEARENVSKRLKAGKRISLRELVYPLMQGYDSVALKADVELGGTDQRFNLLAGRVIQPLYHQTPQDILTVSLLEGTDGRKMSSSWGNAINLTDSPEEMFGKVMSISDDLIEKYFILTTNLALKDIKKVMASGRPRDQKELLALAIVRQYHGDKLAGQAQKNFIARFRLKELPSAMPTVKVKAGRHKLSDLLVKAGLAASKSEARRLFQQKGIKLNGKIPAAEAINLSARGTAVVQVGKRKFVKLVAE